MRMTFSTPVTPTRESESETAGAWACTSSRAVRESDIGVYLRLAVRPPLDEKGMPPVLVVRDIGGTNLRERGRTRTLGVTAHWRRASQIRTAGEIYAGTGPPGGGAVRRCRTEGSRALGTKTEALLEGEPAITEIDELRPLIAEGQEKGVLTFEQIASCLEEVEVTKEQIVELHAFLEGEGIDIVGNDGKPATTEGRKFEPAVREADKERDAPRKPEIDLTVEPSLDSLRLYLRSIGKVELLTADRDVELAKRIERGDLLA